jgi:hypothetical protein
MNLSLSEQLFGRLSTKFPLPPVIEEENGEVQIKFSRLYQKKKSLKDIKKINYPFTRRFNFTFFRPCFAPHTFVPIIIFFN